MKPILLFLLSSLFFTGCIRSNTYYVSNDGDDNNSGKSPQSAWRTLEKVNRQRFLPGDSILFKRGDLWFGQLIPGRGNPEGFITYSDYGFGNVKPIFHRSISLNKPADWEEVSSKIWQYRNIISEDIGHIKMKNPQYGSKVASFEYLQKQGDFWYNKEKQMLFVFSSANPGSVGITCALFGHIIEQSNKSYVVYENLIIRGGGSHGIGGGNTHHIIIRNCDVYEIGGCYLPGYKEGTTRYGNGIEFWAGAHDNIVEGCKVYDIYDAGITNQSAVEGNQFNITYKNNIIWNCEYSFEMFHWYKESYINNVQFINNTCLQAGYSWGHEQRPNPSGRHICLWELTANISDLVIENNIFCDAKEFLIYIPDADHDIHSQLTMDYNCLYFKNKEGEMAVLEVNGEVDYFSQDEFIRYTKKTGFGANSINCDPLLHNICLNKNSCCIDAGNPKYPLDPDGTISDIGASCYWRK